MRLQVRPIVLAALVSSVVAAACSESTAPHSASAAARLRAHGDGPLASRARAEGASFAGIVSTVIEQLDETGAITSRAPQAVQRFEAVVSKGVGRLRREGGPAQIPVVALAAGTAGRFVTGFTEAAVRADGTQDRVVGVASGDGSPIRTLEVYRGGQLITRVTLQWRAADGGYVLASQVAELFRNGRAFARMTTTLEPTSVAERTALMRGAISVAAVAADALLPAPAFANCFGSALEAVGGFAALVVTAPAVTTGVGGVAWIAGWVAWTGTLVNAAEECDE